MQDIRRIDTKDQIKALAAKLGVRLDWHEPDEQKVTVQVAGDTFDNAGHWGTAWDASRARYQEELGPRIHLGGGEFCVTVLQDGQPVAEVNLATLFALACQGSA
jgi:hypothetical protein